MRHIITLLFLIGLSLGLTDCSSVFINQPHYLILADENLKQEHKDAILNALDEWATQTHFDLKYELEFIDMTNVPKDLSMHHTIKIYAVKPPPGDAGWTDWSAKNGAAYTEVDPVYDGDTFRRIMLHELGHAFNLSFDGDPHYKGPDASVMHPSIDQVSSHLQCPELTAFCNEFGCQIDCTDIPE